MNATKRILSKTILISKLQIEYNPVYTDLLIDAIKEIVDKAKVDSIDYDHITVDFRILERSP